jgi:23S rRNA (cytidine1920-2'-O)/16S rRNA (cytidine1409-2'-O)-methyltransferase
MRADQFLVEHGHAVSRAQAQRLIAAGVSWRLSGSDWKRVAKNGDLLPARAEIRLEDVAEARYVSRGGLKLEAALLQAQCLVAGQVCLDVGQSTGGFTDCLLQAGAARVMGVDVGHGQLNARLRSDPRVVCLEQVNARHLDGAFPEAARAALCHGGVARPGFDLVVGDVSFISQTLLLPAIAPWMRPGGGALLMLVKPQFELQPGQLGSGGIVRDEALYPQVESRIRQAHAKAGLEVKGYFPSVIRGGDGNREFFVVSIRS